MSSESSPTASAKKSSTLSIRKSSKLLPLIMLVLTALLFVAYALPSDFGKLSKLLGMKGEAHSAKSILTHAGNLFAGDDAKGSTDFWKSFGFHPLRFIRAIQFTTS